MTTYTWKPLACVGRLLLWIGVFVVFVDARAQEAGGPVSSDPRTERAEQILHAMLLRGFEYVAVSSEANRVVVRYENRVYRYDIRAFDEVMALSFAHLAAGDTLTLIPQRRGIPLVSVQIPEESYREYRSGFISHEVLAESMDVSLDIAGAGKPEKTGAANPNSFKVDLVLNPQLAVQFGSFSDAVRSQVNITPEINLSMWRGMRLSGQVILPLHNELASTESHVRPGLVTINQTLRLPGNTFFGATAGLFTGERYGFDAEVRTYVADGRFGFGGRIGRTGFVLFDRGEWQYSKVNRWTPSATVIYQVPRFEMSLKATYGRFIAHDAGIYFEANRRFGEIEIGFFGISTNSGKNAGFTIRIPLLMRRYSRPSRLRVRPADSFRWTYRYRSLSTSGQTYETGNEIDDLWGGLTPPLVRSLWVDHKIRH